jgi:hypothetical protein
MITLAPTGQSSFATQYYAGHGRMNRDHVACRVERAQRAGDEHGGWLEQQHAIATSCGRNGRGIAEF